jgi:hypothetical protein
MITIAAEQAADEAGERGRHEVHGSGIAATEPAVGLAEPDRCCDQQDRPLGLVQRDGGDDQEGEGVPRFHDAAPFRPRRAIIRSTVLFDHAPPRGGTMPRSVSCRAMACED